MPREIFTTVPVALPIEDYLRVRAVKGLHAAPPLSELGEHARELIALGCDALEKRSQRCAQRQSSEAFFAEQDARVRAWEVLA